MKKQILTVLLLLIGISAVDAGFPGPGDIEEGAVQSTVMRIPADGYMFMGFSETDPTPNEAPSYRNGPLVMGSGHFTAEMTIWTAIRTNWKNWTVTFRASPLKTAEDGAGNVSYLPYEFRIDEQDPIRVEKVDSSELEMFVDRGDRHDSDDAWKHRIDIKAFLDGEDGSGSNGFLPSLTRKHEGTFTLTLTVNA